MSKPSLVKCFPVIYPDECKERYVHDNSLIGSPDKKDLNYSNNKEYVTQDEIQQSSFRQTELHKGTPNSLGLNTLEYVENTVVYFLSPKSGFTLGVNSVDSTGDLIYINICSDTSIKNIVLGLRQDNSGGLCQSHWTIPVVRGDVHQEMDEGGKLCTVHDVIFNPSALLIAQSNSEIMGEVQQVAVDVVQNNCNITLDTDSIRKLNYKFAAKTALIRYKAGEIPSQINPDFIEKTPTIKHKTLRQVAQVAETKPDEHGNIETDNANQKSCVMPKYQLSFDSKDSSYDSDDEWQVYSRKKQNKIPKEIHLTIEMPKEADDANIEVKLLEDGRYFELTSTQYYLRLGLPFQAHCEPMAKFDKGLKQLLVKIKTTVVKKWKSNESSVFENIRNLVKAEMDSHSDDKKNGDGSDKEPDSGIESQDSLESNHTANIPDWENADVVIKSILKQNPRSRSMSESCVDEMSYSKEFFMSLESLDESAEISSRDSSTGLEKSVRFSDSVERRLYRSNSSIFGQRKKNQRKSKNRRKARERAYSEGSASSMDEGETLSGLMTGTNRPKRSSPNSNEDESDEEGDDDALD